MLSWFDTDLNSLAWLDPEIIPIAWFDRLYGATPPGGPSTAFSGIGIPITAAGITLYDEGWVGGPTLTSLNLNAFMTVSPVMNNLPIFPSTQQQVMDVGLGLGGISPIVYGAGNYGAGNYGGSIGPSMALRVKKLTGLAAILNFTATMANQVSNNVLFPVPFTLALGAITSMQKKITKPIAASLTLTSLISPKAKVFKAISAGLTVTPLLSWLVKYFRPQAATLTLSSTMSKLGVLKRTEAATLSLLAGQQFSTSKTKSQTFDLLLVLTPTFNDIEKNYLTIPTSLTLSPADVKKMNSALVASLALNPLMTPAQKRGVSISAGLTMTAALARQIFLHLPTLAVSLSLNPALVRKLISFKRLDGTLTLAPAFVKRMFVTVATPLTLITQLIRNPIRLRPLLNVNLNLNPTEKALRSKSYNATMSLIAALNRRSPTTVAASMSMNPLMKRKVPQREDVILILSSVMGVRPQHPRFSLDVLLSLNVTMDEELHEIKKTLLRSVLLGAILAEPHLLNAELKGN